MCVCVCVVEQMEHNMSVVEKGSVLRFLLPFPGVFSFSRGRDWSDRVYIGLPIPRGVQRYRNFSLLVNYNASECESVLLSCVRVLPEQRPALLVRRRPALRHIYLFISLQ